MAHPSGCVSLGYAPRSAGRVVDDISARGAGGPEFVPRILRKVD